jgi:hypothetical protein
VFNLNTFLATVQIDNPAFKNWAVTSSLDPLIKELKTNTWATAPGKARIERIIAFLPHAKKARYSRSLAYLHLQLQVSIGAIPANTVMKFDAFRVMRGNYKGYKTSGESKIVPLDERTVGSPGPSSFIHRHTLTWSSSDGSVASLGQVRTREYVKFLTDTQAPPFNVIQDPDREFYAPGTQGATGQTSGIDDHSTKLPSLICVYPRQAGLLQAEQKYQYSVDNGTTWVDMDNGQFLLEKKVRQVGNDWVFSFKKTNWAPHNKKSFHFEVEYTVGPLPEYLPRTEADYNKGMEYAGDIKQYARRVIATG